MQAVAQHPVAVLLSHLDLRNAGPGIVKPKFCLNKGTDHYVLVVGYNATGGIGATGTYWLIKASWLTRKDGNNFEGLERDGFGGVPLV
jgi:hypothetical protein